MFYRYICVVCTPVCLATKYSSFFLLREGVLETRRRWMRMCMYLHNYMDSTMRHRLVTLSAQDGVHCECHNRSTTENSNFS